MAVDSFPHLRHRPPSRFPALVGVVNADMGATAAVAAALLGPQSRREIFHAGGGGGTRGGPVIAQRPDHDPRVVVAATASCPLAELAPRLRRAAVTAYSMSSRRCCGRVPSLASLSVRVLWALLRDDGV